MIGHRGGGTAEIRGRQEGDRVGIKRIMGNLSTNSVDEACC